FNLNIASQLKKTPGVSILKMSARPNRIDLKRPYAVGAATEKLLRIGQYGRVSVGFGYTGKKTHGQFVVCIQRIITAKIYTQFGKLRIDGTCYGSRITGRGFCTS